VYLSILSIFGKLSRNAFRLVTIHDFKNSGLLE
jgi:hypothetical protein